jgi:hypothetical protein
VREIQHGREDLHDKHRSGRPAPDYIDTKIISIIEEAPFESVRSIAQVLNVDHATELHRLYEKLGFNFYCLRWVPHLLTGKLRAKYEEIDVTDPIGGLLFPHIEIRFSSKMP